MRALLVVLLSLPVSALAQCPERGDGITVESGRLRVEGPIRFDLYAGTIEPSTLHTIDAGHDQIEQHDVGGVRLDQIQELCARMGRADELDVPGLDQRGADRVENQRVIIGDTDPEHPARNLLSNEWGHLPPHRT